MKKIFSLILLFVLFTVTPVFASVNTYERTEENFRVESWVDINGSNKYKILTTPSVDADEKVYDFADILSSSEKENIYDLIKEFIDTYNMDMVVVTTTSNPRGNAEQYADDFYDYNSFGKNKTRDGLLFIIDLDTRNFYISTTGKAIRIFSDDRIESILDYSEPYMKDGSYYEAISSFVQWSSSYAKKGVPESNKNSYIDDNGNIVYYTKINYLLSVFISGIITFIVITILVNRNKMIKRASNANLYLDKSSLNITSRNDAFLTTHTTSVSLSSSSGGSGHGGSSTHSSSSGSSHGGGGRSF